MFEEEIVIPECFYPEFMFLSIRKRNTSWIPAIALNDNTYVIPNLIGDPDQIFISIIKRIDPYEAKI